MARKTPEKLTCYAIALAYAALSGMWTFFSDSLFAVLLNQPEASHKSVALSHWLFIAISAILIYWLLRFWDVAISSSQESLREVTRALRGVSECTKAITRINDEQELMQEICRIFVKVGGYRFAWVGFAEQDSQKTLRPVAYWGYEDNFVENMQANWADSERGRGPAGTTIRTGKTTVFDDFSTDPDYLPWREKALQCGYASGISLPLWEARKVFGALVIFSEKKNDFDKEEITRMEELAEDLSYGIKTIRMNIDRERALVERLLLASVMDQTTDGVITFDTQGEIQYINQSFVALCGVPADEAVGVSIHDFECSHRNPDFYQTINSVLTNHEARAGHFINKNREGCEYDIDARIAPVFDSKGNVVRYVATIRDISYETGLQRQLRQAQKMEAIATLSGGIAHDFNNILAIIISNAEMTLEDIPQEHPSFNQIKIMHKAGIRGKNLVKQIRALSHPTEQERQPVNIDLIVDECFNQLHASLPTSIDFQKQVSPELGMISADPTQIHQVIMNLCTNAVDAMSENGGQLAIELKELFLDTEAVNAYPGFSSGTYINLTVTDRGHGMERHVLERIFDPFYTTKSQGKGTGLGLSIVHGIVKSHGGEITVASTPGKGTGFSLLFPRIKGTADLTEEKQLPEKTSGRERILFVDDEEDYVTAQKKMLERIGYQVVVATDSRQSLNMFHDNPNAFDLVITDQIMPNLSGDMLARGILRIRPDIPIILCSGSSPETNAAITPEKAGAIGIREVLFKPVDKQQLNQAIRRQLAETDTEVQRGEYAEYSNH